MKHSYSVNTDNSQLKSLQNRQERIIASLPDFGKRTIWAAIVLLVVSFGMKTISDQSFRSNITSVRFSTITIGSIISILLGIFSNFVIWVFVLWSLVFVPYVAYHAHKASREMDIGLDSKPFRWLQLYAATFLPMVVFAMAWNSFAVNQSNEIALLITSPQDFLTLLFWTTTVVILLATINRLIPVGLAVMRLSFFSFLLYLSLFLAYGRGISVASHAMVFGILVYLMFDASQVAELARRISLYDLDPVIVERVESIRTRCQELQTQKGETSLTREEHEAETGKQRLDVEMIEAKSDLALNKQLAEIKARKVDLNREINEVQLSVFQTRIEALGQAFMVISKEFKGRLDAELPNKINRLKNSVKDIPPEELHRKMTEIATEINTSLQGIPESLLELRKQLQAATIELESITQLLTTRRLPAEEDEKKKA